MNTVAGNCHFLTQVQPHPLLPQIFEYINSDVNSFYLSAFSVNLILQYVILTGRIEGTLQVYSNLKTTPTKGVVIGAQHCK